MATATLNGNIGSITGPVYFRIRPTGAYRVDTGAAIANPASILATGTWSQNLEVSTNIFPPDNFWEIWEAVPGADRIWAVQLTVAGQAYTVQQAQMPQPIG